MLQMVLWQLITYYDSHICSFLISFWKVHIQGIVAKIAYQWINIQNTKMENNTNICIR